LNAIELRKRLKGKKPEFLRQEWFRLSSLGRKWRSPKGNQSKLRMHKSGKGFIPHPGYGSPAAARGLHPSGFREVLINNIQSLAGIDPKVFAIRVSATVGRLKRAGIEKVAKEKGLKVLNPRKEADKNVHK